MFEIGDRVVCVNDDATPLLRALYLCWPVKGKVYVIRDLRIGISPDCQTGDISVLLVGMVNPKATSRAKPERGFSESRFRKESDKPIEKDSEMKSLINRAQSKIFKEDWK